ncbi:MAG TPA: hypothetical protein VED84_08225 [Acidimicrobiales bacterium]|nr:hypothetical protein [Acidimicrobiales bacterium]
MTNPPSIVGPRTTRRPAGPQRLKTCLRGFGWLLIAGQLVGLLWWSTVLVDRASMSWDYAIYYQAWYEIAHGHLLVRSTVMTGSIPFWQNDGEFIVYLLAPLYWLFPNHLLGFWWLQDLAYFGTSVVCYRWIGELLPWTEGRPRRDRVVAGVGWTLTVILLVFDPWVYWSVSFAVQMEPFGVFFAILALRALLQRRKTVWIWSLLTAFCGAAETVYVISIGLCGVAVLLMRRHTERRAGAETPTSILQTLTIPAVIGALGIAWLFVLDAMQATRLISSGSSVVSEGLSYLVGTSSRSHGTVELTGYAVHAVLHLATVLRVVATHGWNLWANTAPVGFVGLFAAVGFFLSVPTLLENSVINNQQFSYPGFSNLIVYAALAVASALIVAALLRRRQILGGLLAGIIVVNALAWFALWFPDTENQFVRVDAEAAATIRQTAREIPPNAEVIASQGFVGSFAARQYLYVYGNPQSGFLASERFPVKSTVVWFVLSPNQGIEVPSTATTEGSIGTVARLAGARLTAEDDGVWVIRWNVPSGIRSVSLGGPDTAVPAWTSVGVAARPVQNGPEATWLAKSTGPKGYVVSGDEWALAQGRYAADVKLSSTVPVNVEVWEDSARGDELLARQIVRSPRAEQVLLPFGVPMPQTPASERGSAIFRYEPVPPRDSDNVEIRIWTPGRGHTSVWSLSVNDLSSP